jgi:hypothetical protein
LALGCEQPSWSLSTLRAIAEGGPEYRVVVLATASARYHFADFLLRIDRSGLAVIHLPTEAKNLEGAILRSRLQNWVDCA